MLFKPRNMQLFGHKNVYFVTIKQFTEIRIIEASNFQHILGLINQALARTAPVTEEYQI